MAWRLRACTRVIRLHIGDPVGSLVSQFGHLNAGAACARSVEVSKSWGGSRRALVTLMGRLGGRVGFVRAIGTCREATRRRS